MLQDCNVAGRRIVSCVRYSLPPVPPGRSPCFSGSGVFCPRYSGSPAGLLLSAARIPARRKQRRRKKRLHRKAGFSAFHFTHISDRAGDAFPENPLGQSEAVPQKNDSFTDSHRVPSFPASYSYIQSRAHSNLNHPFSKSTMIPFISSFSTFPRRKDLYSLLSGISISFPSIFSNFSITHLFSFSILHIFISPDFGFFF